MPPKVLPIDTRDTILPRRPHGEGDSLPPKVLPADTSDTILPRRPHGEGVDPRVWPIAGSTFVTGSAIGVALPVMPLLCAELGMSAAEFGLAGSVFGAARLLSNFPLAVATERYGRRPFLVLGPLVTSLSMGTMGLVSSLPALLACRAVSGAGGSAQIAGAQLYLSDISTPANRARTLAPMSAAFSAGASLGPFIGGVLAHNFGVVGLLGRGDLRFILVSW